MTEIQGSNSIGGVNQSADNQFTDANFWFEWVELDRFSNNPVTTLTEAGFDISDGSLGPGQTVYNAGSSDILDLPSLTATLGNNENLFGVRISTTIEIVEGGTYTFDLNSDDGSRLYIDGVEVVEFDGVHPANGPVTDSTTLTPGFHEIVIITFENFGVQSLTVDITGPDYPSPTALENAAVQANSQADTVDAGAGNDSIDGGTGDDSLSGELGNDTLIGGSGNDTLIGGSGNDTLFGGSGSDSIEGEDGDDSISGGANEDTIFGGDGDDTISGDEAGDFIDAGGGNDSIFGGGASDSIIGGAGDDTIDGGDQLDTIFGGDGNDSILGNTASDSIDGGAGSDTIFGGLQSDSITGGTGADVLSGDGADDTISGDDGADEIFGGEGSDSLQGGTGADTILGGASSDVIDGGADGDSLFGGTGSDTIEGGDGADTISGGEQSDVLSGGSGNDSITGEGGSDRIDGGDGADTLKGDAGNETIFGGAGDDSIEGGSSSDVIDGGADDDTIAGGDGNDTVDGGAGDDQISAGNNFDTILASTGTDTIDGGSGTDTYTVPGSSTIVDDSETILVTVDVNGDGTVFKSVDGTTDEIGSVENFIADEASAEADTFVFSTTVTARGTIAGLNGSTGTFTSKQGVVTAFGDTGQPTFADLLAQTNSGTFIANGGDLDGSISGIGFTDFETVQFDVICFTRGTMIRTPDGERAVEDLKPGELVDTADRGAQPIKWIGSQKVSVAALIAQPSLRPIIIRSKFLGGNCDLSVSPQHRVAVSGAATELYFGEHEVLVKAKDLVSAGIAYADDRRFYSEPVEYFHFLLDQHEIVFANGVRSESLHPGDEALGTLSTESRAEILELFPQLRDTAAEPNMLVRPMLKTYEATALGEFHLTCSVASRDGGGHGVWGVGGNNKLTN